MNLSHVDIAYDASEAVRAALVGLGRTEDLRFSPDNRWLAIPSYARNSIGIMAFDIATRDGRPQVTITGIAELSPRDLDDPHGLDFVDNSTIIVVNRHGGVSLLHLDVPDTGVEGAALTPIELPAGAGFELLYGPSALWVARRPDGDHDVLIGHRYEGILTHHVLHDEGSGGFTVTANDVLLRDGIVVVDGVTISPDGDWLAVSNPMHQNIELYRRGSSPAERSKPRCILRGTSYPHGVRFSADGRHLFVADGSSPYIYIHARQGDTWQGVQYPVASIRVLEDDVFQRGRRNARDGGPKGVDIDGTNRILAVTSEFDRVAFFDVAAILEGLPERPDDRDAAVRYELDLARAADERVDERITSLTESTSYRMAHRLARLKSRASIRR